MKITRLLLLLAALATGVFAQETAPAAEPAKTDPAKLALAREVIAVMKADRMFDSMAMQMKQGAAQIAAVPPDATPEQRQKATELQDKIVELSMAAAKEMIGKMDQIYADVYTEAELTAMKTFFSSPEGQSMLAKQPQIMAHVMPLVQEMQRTLIPKVQKLVQDAKLTAPATAPAPTTESK
jgi:uncharacterized protein